MKKILLVLICSLFAFSGYGQILIGRKALEKRIAQERYENQQEQGWDIILDPIETTPEKKRTLSQVDGQAVSNWGVDLLLNASLRQRINSECTFPVTFKVGDTGDPDHLYLVTGHLPPTNYTSAPTPNDLHGHSTHVIGIVCADEFGLANLLVKKGLLKFKACKVLGDSGSGSFSWVANMFIQELADDKQILANGGFVVYNMSLGGGTAKQSVVENAMKASTDAGVLIVCANGNTGTLGVQYPGNSDYTIGTASLDQGTLNRSSYSSYGPETDNAMPGRSINSTYKNNTFAVLSGTSMASPFQAGAVIIAVSKWGNKVRGTEHLRKYLAFCATDIPPVGNDDFTGWGIDYITKILDTDPSTIDNPEPPVPGAPELVSPANGSVNQSLTPVLTWKGTGESFNVVISDNSEFTNTIYNTSVKTLSTTVPSNTLLHGKIYFWRVKSTTASKDSPWSSVWNFTTSNPPAPNPDSLTRELRVLTIPISGEFRMPWKTFTVEENALLEETPAFVEENDPEIKASGTVIVTELQVAIKSNYYFPLVNKSLIDATDKFFKNRSLGIGNGTTDAVDALNWTVYFYDLLLYMNDKLDIQVLFAKCKDEFGRELILSGKDLKQYTPKN